MLAYRPKGKGCSCISRTESVNRDLLDLQLIFIIFVGFSSIYPILSSVLTCKAIMAVSACFTSKRITPFGVAEQ